MQPHFQSVTRVLSPAVELLGDKSDHSPQSSVEFKRARILLSLSLSLSHPHHHQGMCNKTQGQLYFCFALIALVPSLFSFTSVIITFTPSLLHVLCSFKLPIFFSFVPFLFFPSLFVLFLLSRPLTTSKTPVARY